MRSVLERDKRRERGSVMMGGWSVVMSRRGAGWRCQHVVGLAVHLSAAQSSNRGKGGDSRAQWEISDTSLHY